MKKLLILGAGGMVGSALVRAAKKRGYSDILTPSSKELDLCNQADTHAYLADCQPDEVIVAAAKVGGIHANSTYPADFIYKNLMIAANAIEASYQAGVSRLLFLGSSCIYPKLAPQPMPESCLLTSDLEPTNEAYAVAKIAGLKLCQHYRKQYGVTFHSAMPTNLYGPGDNYHPENSHVIPAMIRRFHEARESGAESVTIWGTGTPQRDFLYVDDLAEAVRKWLLNGKCPRRVFELHDGHPDGYSWKDVIDTVGRLNTKHVRCIHVPVPAVVGLAKLNLFAARMFGYEPMLTPYKIRELKHPDWVCDNTAFTRETGWTPRVSLEEGLRRTLGI